MMRRLLVLLVCAVGVIVVAGVLIMPGFGGALGLRVLPALYSTLVAERVPVEAGVRYGPHARNRLDVYRPPPSGLAGVDTGPVVVFIYGGSWRRGERGVYGFLGAALAARGITTVIPDYRLYPEVTFPGFVEDAAAAVAWSAKTLGAGAGSRRPLLLMGHSAGAHTAALVALDGRYLARAGIAPDAIAGLIGLAGPYAFDPITDPTTKDVFAGANPIEVRPVDFVKTRAPPALLMHGDKDTTVKVGNMKALHEALTGVGSRVRMLEPAGIGHTGLVLAISRPLRWLEEIVGFVEGVARE